MLNRELATAFELIGTSYGLENSLDSMRKYSDKAISIFKKYPEKLIYEDLSLSYLAKSEYLIETKEYDSAFLYINKSIDLIEKNDSLYPLFMYHQNLAKLYFYQEKWDKALFYYLKYLEEYETYPQDENDDIIEYKTIAGIYQNLGQPEKEKEYLKIYSDKLSKQSIENKKNTSYAINLIVEQKKLEREKTIKRLSIPIVFFSLTTMGLGWYWRRERKKIKYFKSESKVKMQIKEKETAILKKKINESFEEVLRLAKENHPHFWTRFQEVYPEFAKKLLNYCPNLKTTELTSLAYIYLGFSTKEIADYTFRAVKTVENNRSNIRKKLQLSSADELYTWLHNLID